MCARYEKLEEKPLKMKKPWLAALLNFILPGLGFIYVGTVGWIIGGIILLLFTLSGKYTPVVWLVTGAGIPEISAWFVLALFTTPICIYAVNRRNRKIKNKAKSTHAPPLTPAPQLPTTTVCPRCGAELRAGAKFCHRCGAKVESVLILDRKSRNFWLKLEEIHDRLVYIIGGLERLKGFDVHGLPGLGFGCDWAEAELNGLFGDEVIKHITGYVYNSREDRALREMTEYKEGKVYLKEEKLREFIISYNLFIKEVKETLGDKTIKNLSVEDFKHVEAPFLNSFEDLFSEIGAWQKYELAFKKLFELELSDESKNFLETKYSTLKKLMDESPFIVEQELSLIETEWNSLCSIMRKFVVYKDVIDLEGLDNCLRELYIQREEALTEPSDLSKNVDKSYIDSCFKFELTEEADERDIFEIEDGKLMHRKATGEGDLEGALNIAHRLKERYPDFDAIYGWISFIYKQMGRTDHAKQILLEGLNVCRRKHVICAKLGEIACENGNIEEAVCWWIRSLLLQLKTGVKEGDDIRSLLGLAAVAEAIGMDDLSKHLLRMADEIDPRVIRLTGEKVFSIYELVSEKPVNIRCALQVLSRKLSPRAVGN